MPSLQATIGNEPRVLDARPDRFDLRDRIYQPKLVNLPPCYPEPALASKMLKVYRNQRLVLDQGNQGACTGFGLAAMVNYLRFKPWYFEKPGSGGKKSAAPAPVSPRMLYEHARLYDEWPGEDYEGSSCRGAMKGWHRHGVCPEKIWPYGTAANPGKPRANWQKAAAAAPLGSYYRVETCDLTAVQSAIHEVGAVYASADVHAGWDLQASLKLPEIQWHLGIASEGGHAFALVGFNDLGFIVQNSWGPGWGYHGFAVVTYDDWLANSTDAWVASMGAARTAGTIPTNFATRSYLLATGSTPAAPASRKPGADVWSEDEARDHTLLLGNNGTLLRSSAAYTSNSFVTEGLVSRIDLWMKSAATNRKLTVVLHGGLNSEEAAVKRARVMGPHFKANGVFPIFIAWKTGWQESLFNMGEDTLGRILPGDHSRNRSGRFLGWLGEKVSDGWDYTVENALGFLGKSLWREMKQNALAAGDASRGGAILASALGKLRVRHSDFELHLVGHSAGAIWIGHFLTELGSPGVNAGPVTSCHLFAAASSVPFANAHYGKAFQTGLLPGESTWFHNLSNEAELADNVGGFYRRSLLYFVSRACEEVHKMPILGMEAAWNSTFDRENIFKADFLPDLKQWRKLGKTYKVPAPALIPVTHSVFDGERSCPPSHGGFDNDIAVISKTLERIRGKPLARPIDWLGGF